MPGALGTIRAVLRLPSLRRLIPAFLAFSVAEWASWIGIVVYAYSRGGPSEAGIVAGVVFIPSIIVAPAASMFGDRRPRTQVLAAAYAILALSMAATAVALAAAPPFVAYVMATLAATSITLVRPAHGALLPEVAQKPDELAVANAASGTVEGLGALLGPLLAGLLIAVAGPAAVYGANALLALGAVAAVLPLARGALPVLEAPAARTQGLLRRTRCGPADGARRPPAACCHGGPERRDRAAWCVQRAPHHHRDRPARRPGEHDRVRGGRCGCRRGRGCGTHQRPHGPRAPGDDLRRGGRAVCGFGGGHRARPGLGRGPRLRRRGGHGLGIRVRRGAHARPAAGRRRRDEPGLRRDGVDDDGLAGGGRTRRPAAHRGVRADCGDHRLRAGVRTRGRGRGTDADPRRPSRPQPRPPIAGAAARADVRAAVGAGPRTARNELDDDVGRGRGDDRGCRRGRRPLLRDPVRGGGRRAARPAGGGRSRPGNRSGRSRWCRTSRGPPP